MKNNAKISNTKKFILTKTQKMKMKLIKEGKNKLIQRNKIELKKNK
jgi:hypothetical protein